MNKEDFIDAYLVNFFSGIFGNVEKEDEQRILYFLPNYQRPYAWGDKQIEDFWNDIIMSMENKIDQNQQDNLHFFGNISLAEITNKENLQKYVNPEILESSEVSSIVNNFGGKFYLIIDGQQRITTYFLYLISFSDQEINKFLYWNYYPKLILGKVDYEFFIGLVRGKETTTRTNSNDKLDRALKYFKEMISSYDKRNELKSYSMSKLKIIRSVIKENYLHLANTIFVAQTDRGKRLTTLERLKSLMMFYVEKLPSNKEALTNEIDNLFSKIFESIEELVKSEIYDEVENAEADVIRILHVLLKNNDYLSDYDYDFYKNYYIANKNGEKKPTYVWWEIGEENTYEIINKIFRHNFNKEDVSQLNKIIGIIKSTLRDINALFEHLNKKAKLLEKDYYKGKTWLPYIFTFRILDLSRFKALLADAIKYSFNIDQPLGINKKTNNKDLLEVTKYKQLNQKLKILLNDESGKDVEGYKDIDAIKSNDKNAVINFLKDELKKTETKIEKFNEFAKEGKRSFVNLLEELEMSIWKIGKRPMEDYFRKKWNDVRKNKYDIKSLEEFADFSYEYKKDYLLRDLGYGSYKYILLEYERLNYEYSVEELIRDFVKEDTIDKGDAIHREHIFSQNPQRKESEKELSNIWSEFGRESSYSDWIWRIGNIALTESTINRSSSNKEIWEKGKLYKDSRFEGTRELGEKICELYKLVKEENDELKYAAFKIMLEIRELELYAFTFFRFS